MEILPDRANLDHLKKQAKDLLRLAALAIARRSRRSPTISRPRAPQHAICASTTPNPVWRAAMASRLGPS